MTDSTELSAITDELEVEICELGSALHPNKMRVLYLWATGGVRDYTTLGALCDVAPSTVSRWLRSEELQTILVKLQAKDNEIINSGLNAMRLKALNRLDELLDASSEKVRLDAVKDVLDRTGHSAEKKIKKDVSFSYEKQLLELGNEVTVEAK